MKGLVHLPTDSDLARAYVSLQSHALPEMARLGLWSQWSRFDARLAEQIVQFIRTNYATISPLELRSAALAQPWPHALGALLEQVDAVFDLGEERALYRSWMNCVTQGFSRASNELFFIGLARPGGKLMEKEASRPLRSFLKWGYLSAEVLRNKVASGSGSGKTLVSLERRKRVLREISLRVQSMRVEDYLLAIGPGLSRRQAQRDMLEFFGKRTRGATRSKRYGRG